MDAAQAIGELMELSSQITAAVALGEDGSVLASSTDDQGAVASLSSSTLELVSAAADLGDGGEVTRVEVELAEGAFFVVREGDRTVAATTGPKPTSGLVVYDLRTCAQAIDSTPKKKRATRKPKEESE